MSGDRLTQTRGKKKHRTCPCPARISCQEIHDFARSRSKMMMMMMMTMRKRSRRRRRRERRRTRSRFRARSLDGDCARALFKLIARDRFLRSEYPLLFMIHKGTRLAFSGYYTNLRLGVTFTAHAPPCAAVVKAHIAGRALARALLTFTIRHARTFRRFRFTTESRVRAFNALVVTRRKQSLPRETRDPRSQRCCTRDVKRTRLSIRSGFRSSAKARRASVACIVHDP